MKIFSTHIDIALNSDLCIFRIQFLLFSGDEPEIMDKDSTSNEQFTIINLKKQLEPQKVRETNK